MVDVLPVGITFGAERSFAVGILLRPLDFDYHTVLYIRVYTAVRLGIADITDTFTDLDAAFRTRHLALEKSLVSTVCVPIHGAYLP